MKGKYRKAYKRAPKRTKTARRSYKSKAKRKMYAKRRQPLVSGMRYEKIKLNNVVPLVFRANTPEYTITVNRFKQTKYSGVGPTSTVVAYGPDYQNGAGTPVVNNQNPRYILNMT